MATATQDDRQFAEIAARHGVSTAAARELLAAIAAGGGRQAQFNHPDLGGMGQWSQGGMIMIGDMFNQSRKARVAALCQELATVLQNDASPARGASLDPAQQHGGRRSSPQASRASWPADLGAPTSTGSQNDMRYAVFPSMHRLAIEQHGQMIVYDTGDHCIGGVSQQQSADQTLQFTSQSGVVRLSELAVVPG